MSSPPDAPVLTGPSLPSPAPLQERVGEAVSGTVEKVTYHNEETGYVVLKVRIRGKREAITLVGHAPRISAGETFEANGEWVNHREFGLQFKAVTIHTAQPSTLEGIEKYLGSGLVKGVGSHFAEKLVKAFGKDVFDIIENDPERLRRVSGLGRVRIQKITESWAQQKAIREIMVFLQSHGVGTSRAVRIYHAYGSDAIERVTENPFALARDIAGIGFKSADQIATNLGVPRDSTTRVRAGLFHILGERLNQGHCAYPRAKLFQEAGTLLEVEPALIEEALHLEIQERSLIGEIIDGEPCLYTAAAYHAEEGIAQLLLELCRAPLPWGKLEVPKALEWVGRKLSLQLGESQQEALGKALHSKCFILTGGPGTGKTTLTRALTHIWETRGMRVALCSPTGRAAKRLSECTGREAKTIHRLLGFDRRQGFQQNRDAPVEADCVLVDEVSMVDTFLMYSLLKAIRPEAALVLVGDVDQIPSVGPGCVLRSLIESGSIATVKLNQIYRQGAKSRIVESAHRIQSGQLPELAHQEGSDFYFIPSESPSTTVKTLAELVAQRIPKKFHLDRLRDVQVLTPMNRGGLGAHALNAELQKVLNPSPTKKVERFGTTFSPGDKVMVTANDYDKEVFNGDIGFISDIEVEEGEARVDFDGREVPFSFGEMDILSLAYATTIHKAQGSEYPAVVVVISGQHHVMLRRNLLYTAVTRGKKLVVILGQRKALSAAISSEDQSKRGSHLAHKIRLSLSQG